MSEKSPAELYAERVKRVLDVAALRVPDRVPVFGPYQLYPYTFAGVSFKDAMNDYGLAREACHKFQDYFQPDLDFGPILAYPADRTGRFSHLHIIWFLHILSPRTAARRGCGTGGWFARALRKRAGRPTLGVQVCIAFDCCWPPACSPFSAHRGPRPLRPRGKLSP